MFFDLRLPVFNRYAVLLINLVVSYLVFSITKHSKLRDSKSRLFLGMGAFMLTWVDFAYLARVFGTVSLAWSEIFLRVAWVATPLLFLMTYLVARVLVKGKFFFSITNNVAILVGTTLSLMTLSSNLVIEGIRYSNDVLDIIYGRGFYPFLAGVFILMLLTVVPLIRYQLNRGNKVFLFGVAIFYIFNLIFNITLPVFFGITHLYYFGDYSTLFLLGFTAYAIIQHELFELKVAVAEVLTIAICGILLVQVFIAQSGEELVIDILTFVSAIVFGLLLVRSVKSEIRQKEELQRLTDRLKALDKQKDEFLSMAAHELRAPLTAIKGYVSMVVGEDFGTIPLKAKSYLSDASSVNDRLIRLVNNMLNVSRIEEGRMVYSVGDVNMRDVVKQVHAAFRFEAERKSLSFEVEIPKDIKDKVRVDQDRIHEVIGNFVSNAVKYTEKGGIRVKLSNPTPTRIRVEVIDSGPGISAAEQKKLFRKFYRVESEVGKTIGTGLGLYISKLLIEKFQGTMGLVSQEGKGSNFWFELPLVTADTPPIQGTTSESSPTQSQKNV